MNMRLDCLLFILICNTGFAMQPQEAEQQAPQQSSWKQYFTKKRVVIGACAVAAAGIALWYARSLKKVDVVTASSKLAQQPQSPTIQHSSAQSPTRNPLAAPSGISQTQAAPMAATPSLSTPPSQQQTAVTKPAPVKIDLRNQSISGLYEKASQSGQYAGCAGGVVAVHTYPPDKNYNHIKCITVNGLGHELQDFCFDLHSKAMLTITQSECPHLHHDSRITRNVDHIRSHPTEITLGKQKITFTGPWTMEIEG